MSKYLVVACTVFLFGSLVCSEGGLALYVNTSSGNDRYRIPIVLNQLRMGESASRIIAEHVFPAELVRRAHARLGWEDAYARVARHAHLEQKIAEKKLQDAADAQRRAEERRAHLLDGLEKAMFDQRTLEQLSRTQALGRLQERYEERVIRLMELRRRRLEQNPHYVADLVEERYMRLDLEYSSDEQISYEDCLSSSPFFVPSAFDDQPGTAWYEPEQQSGCLKEFFHFLGWLCSRLCC